MGFLMMHASPEVYPTLKTNANATQFESWLDEWQKQNPGSHWLSYRQRIAASRVGRYGKGTSSKLFVVAALINIVQRYPNKEPATEAMTHRQDNMAAEGKSSVVFLFG